MLDDYTKAEFPLDLPWNYGRVRLLAAFGDKVIGAVLLTSTDAAGVESLTIAQAIFWDGQGIYADGQYPEMNLTPPPAKVEARIAELQDQIASAQGRLDGMPDAPQEWRGIDERMIDRAKAQIAKLRGDA